MLALPDRDLRAIGITNQRETTVVWDRKTGEPLHRAVVWQSRQTADICEEIRDDGLEPLITERTGLVVDPYFSGSKIRWILERYPEARPRAEAGELIFGTIDSWLLFKLTGGRSTPPNRPMLPGLCSTTSTNAAGTLICWRSSACPRP